MRRIPARTQAICISDGNGAVEMSLTVKRITASGAGLVRKAVPARVRRRYAVGGAVLALAAFGTVTALPAQAAHQQSTRTAVSANRGQCTPPPSPTLPGFRSRFVSVSGDSSLHYEIGGSGPVLVLVHGWPLTWWDFSNIMPTLAKSYTVIAFDLPGLGNSAPSTTGGGFAPIATLLHSAVEAIGFGSQQISLLGHDAGSNVAYAYARLFPASVFREMVIESALNGYGLESLAGDSFHFTFNQQPATVTEGIINNVASSDAYLDYLYSFVSKPGAITAQDKAIWDGDYACPANREAGYDLYRAFSQDATFDTTTNTSKLTIETAAVGGENSFGDFTATSWDNVDSDVHTIIAPGSGHYVPEEDPAFLSECATLFFSHNPPGTAPSGFEACMP
jgi:pimeloyl-ACP methyl ester carboxylesterase